MSVYNINKGVSKPIVFRGLKAQYIAYLAIGLVALLIGFAILYICGLSLWVILPLVLVLGTGLFTVVFRLSHKFGEHGLSKHLAKKQLPDGIRCRSRKLFIHLKTEQSDLLSTTKKQINSRKNNGHGNSH